MKRKGNVSTIIASVIAIAILMSSFLLIIYRNVDLQKYSLINQYARDILLICETKQPIPADYLQNSLNKLKNNLKIKPGEEVNIYVRINGQEYDVSNLNSDILTDFGDEIEVQIEYKYKPTIFTPDKFIIKKDDNAEGYMQITLSTVSKNRATSDD